MTGAGGTGSRLTFGHAEPTRITYQRVESHVEEITTATKTEKGNSPATVNKKLRYIRSGLQAAVRRG